MGRKPRNHRKSWTSREVTRLRSLPKQGVDTDDIAKELERTKYAIESKASEEKISLNPKDKKEKR